VTRSFTIEQHLTEHSPANHARTFVLAFMRTEESALKVPMIKSFRTTTGATLKSAMEVIGALFERGQVEFTALLQDNDVFQLRQHFSQFGYSVAEQHSIDDVKPGDYGYLEALIAVLPRMPEHPGPASAQLEDIARIAAHLGYPEAAKILDDLINLSIRVSPPAVAVG